MSLPRKLKHMNLFDGGKSYIGQVAEVVLPPLEKKMEEWRGGGMNAPIKTDMGMEAMAIEWTCGGFMSEPYKHAKTHNAVQLRFAGSYQAEDSPDPVSVEVYAHGRHSKIDPGTAKTGDDTEFKVTTEISYIKLVMGGKVLREIDIINMIDKDATGYDALAKHRKAIGV